MSLSQYAQPAEARIARKIVADALAKNWKVCVFDGEEWPLESSTKETEILEAMCSTDSDVLRFRDADGQPVGKVWLIWGNDEDVISDHTDSPEMNEFMEGRY